MSDTPESGSHALYEMREPEVALVYRWSEQSVEVLCPYCNGSHYHRSPNWNNDNERLKAVDKPCRGGFYSVTFPFEDDGGIYGWEIDRKAGCFYATTKDGRVPSPEDLFKPYKQSLPGHQKPNSGLVELNVRETSTTDLADGMRRIVLEDTGTKTDTESGLVAPAERSSTDGMVWLKNRCAKFTDLCRAGEIADTQRILDKYPEDNMHLRYDMEGCCGAHYAVQASSNNVRMLHLLKEHGFKLDHANHYGRTPLMEAALWARADAVEYLIEQGANVMAFDANRMTALDLAKDTHRNRHERSRTEPSVCSPLRWDTRIRQRIVKMLGVHMPRENDDPSTAGLDTSCFFQLSGKWIFIRPEKLYETPGPDSRKALAVLDRGPAYPVQAALSGYQQPGWPNVLDNVIWTRKAEELGQYMGFETGLSYYSHVERQLAAFYVDKHLRYDLDENFPDEMFWPGELPPLRIFLNQTECCDDCKAFFERLRQKFQVEPEFFFL